MKTTTLFIISILPPLFLLGQTNTDKCISCTDNQVNTLYGASAIGTGNSSLGVNSFAGGFQNVSSGDYSFTFGRGNLSSAECSIALGKTATAKGTQSLAFGLLSEASGISSVALGAYSKTSSEALLSIAIGSKVTSNVERSMTIGYGMYENPIVNNIENSLMAGFNSDMPTLFIGPSEGIGKTGRIGIGNVTSPQAKLHIKSDINEDAILKLETATTGKISRVIWGSDDYFLSVIPGSDMRISIPAGKRFCFEHGKIVTTAFQYVISGAAAGYLLQSTDATGNSVWAAPAWSINGSNVYKTSGNVGIGLSNPSDKLEVSGIIKSSSGFKIGSNTVINATSDYNGRNGTFTGKVMIYRSGTYAGSVSIGNSNQPEMLEINGKTKTKQLQIFNEIPQTPPSNCTGYLLSSADEFGNAAWVPPSSFDDGDWTKNAGNVYYNQGFVGIGTDNPDSQLDMTGLLTVRTGINTGTSHYRLSMGKANSDVLASATAYLGFNTERTPDNHWSILSDNTNNGGALIWGNTIGELIFSCIKSNGNSNQILTDAQIKENAKMKLTGDGVLQTNEVLVKVDIWSDYVFNDDYQLMNLTDLGSYIKKNKCLPDIPNEKEVVENGVNVGRMNALLLKKIEELTLYLIDQQKILENQQKEIENMKRLIATSISF